MVGENQEVHRETDEARGGSTPHIVRWVLGISLFAAIVLLSAIWIFGAWSQDPSEEASQAQDRMVGADSTGGTDGVLIENADAMGTLDDGSETRDGLDATENSPEPAQ